MNLISCNLSCKYQSDGYCYLNDTKGAKHCGNEQCIYFEAQEEPTDPIFNSSDDSELL